MSMTGLTINRLPVLTWFRLGVNDTNVILDDVQNPSSGRSSVAVSLPEGVRMETASCFSEYRIPRETYVAGKAPIRGEGAFPTALGEQFQVFLKKEPVQTIEIPEGYISSEPVFLGLIHRGGDDEKLQLQIHAGEGSDTKVILCSRSCGECDAAGTDSGREGLRTEELVSVRIVLEKGAKLELNRVNLLDRSTTLLDDVGVYEAREAHFEYRKADLGSGESYGGCSVYTAGRRSSAVIETAYLKTGEQLLDMNYHVIHGGRQSVSRIDMKGVLAGNASKTFRGTIDFRKGCRGADGEEREEVCLLDECVVNKTVPVILCEEDDVNGCHGASIGRIGEEELFYCESRGIDETEAGYLLVRGRLMNIIQKIPDESLCREIECRIRDQLGVSYGKSLHRCVGKDRV